MSQIISAIPADALLPFVGGAIGWVGHMFWFRAERANVTAGLTRIRRFQAENDAWLDGHKARFAPAAAIEAAPEEKPHEAEVLHVEYPTGELRALNATDPQVAAGLAALADEVGLVQALDDETEHRPTCPDLFYCPTVDEVESGCHGGFDVCCYAPELHRPMTEAELDDPAWNKLIPPADDTDRPGLHLVLLAVPVALWDRLCEWWQSLWAARRERHMVGSGEQATDGDPFAELLAHVEHDRTSEAEELALLDEQWRTAVAAARAESAPRHASDEVAQDKGYRGSRWAAGIEHTGLHPIVVPAPRSGDADA